MDRGWTVVLPVKGGPDGKSRLRSALRSTDADALAAAIAGDCLEAVLACPTVALVLVVTADGDAAQQARSQGAHVIAERNPGAGLLAAVADGAAAAPRGPVAVLLGDLAALRPQDLTQALTAAGKALESGARMAAVPDADQRGTVLLAASSARRLDPAFGPGSFAEHLRRGAVGLLLDLPRLRRDVDTPADLDAALALGCGPRTTALAGRASSEACSG